MLEEFSRIQSRQPARRKPVPVADTPPGGARPDKAALTAAFRKRFGAAVGIHARCRQCDGPVAETMQCCPWCGIDNPAVGETRSFPAHCPRCERGVKLDWDYCAWCYGPGFEAETNRHYSDRRYSARCSNRRCGQPLMPFMRYCPWCRAKVKRKWQLRGSGRRCRSCGWGIAAEFWNYCAWCREPVVAAVRQRKHG